ncbi:MAG TPA: cytochrome c-type biogenesis protein CcmH [Candidatus Polarisedimenticolia bacterium]|nr:cytochrome c-type biogenesis protein CcmH [Candidatus Polarisedimenticolia bacterium]
MSRRDVASSGLARVFLIGLALVWAPHVPGSLAAEDTPSPLHTEGHSSAPIVESPQAMQVTTTIQCFCGTCVNQTIHDCTCGLASAERARVASALAKGATPESLIAAYVAENGPQVRIVPERR